ncbi:unnamed protein product [Dibothriocephalus latus]|uniref:Reverse transcriptase domain-containing protein n=1 Tax=Dibothriocephalus latus TaxID=60516 RepID=A0A3P7NX67_DIBLA|nr:unnamed protein product [Dibothriocephalus latus]
MAHYRALKNTLLQFPNVFTWAGQPIGRIGMVQHEIITDTARPQRQPARRIPVHYQTELNDIILDLLSQGIIESSNSPWAAPRLDSVVNPPNAVEAKSACGSLHKGDMWMQMTKRMSPVRFGQRQFEKPIA